LFHISAMTKTAQGNRGTGRHAAQHSAAPAQHPSPRKGGNMASKKEADICKECGSARLVRDYEQGEIVCANCGLIAEEIYTLQFSRTELKALQFVLKEAVYKGLGDIYHERGEKEAAALWKAYSAIKGANE
jgi:hypothetical protein